MFLIEELWTDRLENEHPAAVGYKAIGFVAEQTDADALIERAGVVDGTGWPIKLGDTMPKLRARSLPWLVL